MSERSHHRRVDTPPPQVPNGEIVRSPPSTRRALSFSGEIRVEWIVGGMMAIGVAGGLNLWKTGQYFARLESQNSYITQTLDQRAVWMKEKDVVERQHDAALGGVAADLALLRKDMAIAAKDLDKADASLRAIAARLDTVERARN